MIGDVLYAEWLDRILPDRYRTKLECSVSVVRYDDDRRFDCWTMHFNVQGVGATKQQSFVEFYPTLFFKRTRAATQQQQTLSMCSQRKRTNIDALPWSPFKIH